MIWRSFTQGPWECRRAKTPDNTGGYDFAIVADGKIIAEAFENVDFGDGRVGYESRPVQKNAHLIAAAPELYEAAAKHLEWIEKEHAGPQYDNLTRDTHPVGEQIWSQWWNEQLDLCAETERLCRTALAKARGEAVSNG